MPDSQTISPHRHVICWFSCGAASAVAAKLTVEKYPRAQVVYCNTMDSEHVDNPSFMLAVRCWVRRPIKIISSDKYKNVDEVFEDKHYLAGIHGAPCSREMKAAPRLAMAEPDDLNVWGYTSDKRDAARAKRFERNNPELDNEFPLIDHGISKKACFAILDLAGIRLPEMYAEGFPNNNCIGCVKCSSPAYWAKVRRLYPAVYQRRCEQSRRFGARLVEIRHHERIFLDELPEMEDAEVTESVSCGPICEIGDRQ